MTEEELRAAKIKKYVDPHIKVIDNKKCKKCSSCEKWLSLDLFSTEGKKTYITGEQKRRYECNNCKNIKKKKRKNTDPNYKILEYARTRLYQALKKNQKSDHTIQLLGCTIEELWIHLESKFAYGMTSNAEQGISVSLSSDGNTLAVGGNADDGAKGAVWIFIRTSGVWSQEGSKLVGTGVCI